MSRSIICSLLLLHSTLRSNELRQYKIDLLEEGSAGFKFMSNVIFNKLPLSVKKELIHRVNDNYPTLTHLFANYREIIKTLVKVSRPKISNAKSDTSVHNKDQSSGHKQWSKPPPPAKVSLPPAKPSQSVSSPSTLENFNTSVSNVVSKASHESSNIKTCKLCYLITSNNL